MNLEKFKYDNQIVKLFIIATVVWGVVALLVGLWIAIALYWPALNLGLPYTTFGRLRPLHTNAAVFAFVGNAIFVGVYYSLQRITKSRMFSDVLSKINFWGWQLVIVLAAVTLPLGLTTSKEYAELEWPIDILITVIWVVFGINMIMTLVKRREKHIYVAAWFYISTFVTVAVLHLGNSVEIPVGLFKSYPVYAGIQDALVQWWYGHNAVAFFLTTPFLGIMYYFLPKAANRPIFSYKLSILHFWTLIFIYIWAGPHHLLYTALPNWAQSLGVVFSIMLWMPSWGGMLNGLLTLRGAWDRVRDNPVLKFFVVAVTAYGMSTFEGPMLSLKNVNALAHFTDWIPAHVHVGTLGWNGFMIFGMLYYLVPKMWNTELYSKKLANAHFWIGTLGIVLWVIPMWWAGIAQALMWKEFTPLGLLKYPNFLETVIQIVPMYIMRSIGGTIYYIGLFVMIYNLMKTAKQGSFVANEEAEAAPIGEITDKPKWGMIHRYIESKTMLFTGLAFLAIAIGGLVEIVPLYLVESNVATIASVQPYTPLELQGRDLYIREGCNNCHTQMVRPFRSEVERYGEYSKAGEFVYDHPHLWGSKRTGPDLHRIGGKYSNMWHYMHMDDPQSMSPGSLMPVYTWLLEDNLDISTTAAKISGMRSIGVPYEEGYEDIANDDLAAQAETITNDLIESGVAAESDKEIIALIAYLQRLGTDIKAEVADNK
ncbi:MAG: cytochrome-c oxidase, cbb3-type subunit I [Melioribacteraceae bacterium]